MLGMAIVNDMVLAVCVAISAVAAAKVLAIFWAFF